MFSVFSISCCWEVSGGKIDRSSSYNFNLGSLINFHDVVFSGLYLKIKGVFGCRENDRQLPNHGHDRLTATNDNGRVFGSHF
jgi:hypothetical protein